MFIYIYIYICFFSLFFVFPFFLQASEQISAIVNKLKGRSFAIAEANAIKDLVEGQVCIDQGAKDEIVPLVLQNAQK